MSYHIAMAAVAGALLATSSLFAQYQPSPGYPSAPSPYGGNGYGQSPYGGAPATPSPYGGSPYQSAPYGNPYGGSSYQSNPYGGSPYGSSSYGNAPGTTPYGGDRYVVQSQPVYEYYKYCTSCNKKVSNSTSVGDRCPHCGILFVSDDANPSARYSGGGANFNLNSRHMGGVLRVLGLVVVLLISGVVFVVRQTMRPARRSAVAKPFAPFASGFSSAKPAPQQQAAVNPFRDLPTDAPFVDDGAAGDASNHSVSELRRRFRGDS